MKLVAFAFVAAAAASPGLAASTGLSGAWYKTAEVAGNSLASAQAVVDGAAPDATFIATELNYPQVSRSNTLPTFLGGGATGLSGDLASSTAESVFLFEGLIRLEAGTNTFGVSADDGFRLSIDGQEVVSRDGLSNFGFKSGDFSAPVDGHYSFELLFFDGQATEIGLGVTLNDAFVNADITKTGPTPIPVPAALPLLAAALGAAGWVGRRRR